MSKPMKALFHFFTQSAYVKAGSKDEIDGVIISKDLFDKMQGYIKWAQDTIGELSFDFDRVDMQYRQQIEKVNAQIKSINKKIEEIFGSRSFGDSDKIVLMLEKAIKELESDVSIEVGDPFKKGKRGGSFSTISDPKLDKTRGGIIIPTNDKVDYAGRYVKIEKVISTLGPIIEKMYEEQQEKKAKAPKLDEIIAEKMSKTGKDYIRECNGAKTVKVTNKTVLKKRTVPILLALGLVSSLAVGTFRGNKVTLSGAHGNPASVTGVEQQIEEAKDEYQTALEHLGIDLQRQLDEEKTLNRFDGDPSLQAEEKVAEYQDEIGDGLIKQEDSIVSNYEDLHELSPEESAEYFLQQYNWLIQQYGEILNVYNENLTCSKDLIEANQEHIDISNRTKEPNADQYGLIDSLDNKDIERHELQIKNSEGRQNEIIEDSNEINQQIDEAKSRIEFIEGIKKLEKFKNIRTGNFENVFESLYQMYKGKANQISVDEFLSLIGESQYDLNLIGEYAKEEISELPLEESLARFELISNSYEVYLKEYSLEDIQVDISSYIQYVNQFITDNPEIGQKDGFFSVLEGQFSQNDMNSGFYGNRQENSKKEGVMKSIIRNVKTLFNGKRRDEYIKAVEKWEKRINEANNKNKDIDEKEDVDIDNEGIDK